MFDLSDISVTNERKRWEQLHKIKSMPIPMAEKREIKAHLAIIQTLKLQGWKRLKFKQKIFIEAFSTKWTHRMRNFVFWQKPLQEIEVRCGTSIVNVFFFIKWTLFLNIWISAIIIAFLILPYFVAAKDSNLMCPPQFNKEISYLTVKPSMSNATIAKCCKALAFKIDNNSTVPEFVNKILNITAPLFYGYYEDVITGPFKYNFAMAYALVTGTIFAFCLILMVRQIGHGIKEMIIAKEGKFYKYSNLIFAGWDHYTKDDDGAKFKQKILKHEMKITLKAEKRKLRKSTRSKKQIHKLYAKRFLATMISISLQVIFGLMIYYSYEYSISEKTSSWRQSLANPELERSLIGLLPSILISAVNLIYPNILKHLGKMEKYSPEYQTGLILIRALFVRLSSISLVIFKFYNDQYCKLEKGFCFTCNSTTSSKKQRVTCWESIFAEQIYKIIIMDLIFKIVMVFGIDFARVKIASYIPTKILKKIFMQDIGVLEFNIVRHSLDIVYIQSLSWLGFYFAPFMPIFVCFYCLAVFYIKKFSVLVCCQAVPDSFRTSRTTTIFIVTKLISFTVVSLGMGFVIGKLEPSKDCGPFREYDYAWQVMDLNFKTFDNFFEVMKSPGVTTPIAIILFLTIYYYYAILQANREMVETLKNLLVLEGRDKQFLFAKLNALRRESETDISRIQKKKSNTTSTSRRTRSAKDSDQIIQKKQK